MNDFAKKKRINKKIYVINYDIVNLYHSHQTHIYISECMYALVSVKPPFAI